MARILGLSDEHATPGLRQALGQSLRLFDEAIVLPQAHKSVESGAFKNVAFRLSGTEPDLSGEVFSTSWFAGVSACQVPAAEAEALLKDPVRRASALKRLAAAIPSEMASSEITVGPDLEGDDDDRDLKSWVAGFDSPSSCCGLYSATHSKPMEMGKMGISRTHKIYFLIVKAGAGIAAETFHSRLTSSLNKGMSLDEALAPGSEPGAQALRRLSMAGQRNRGRVLVMASEALGFHGIDTIGDNATAATVPQFRLAVTQINVSNNTIRAVEGVGASVYQYSACIDSTISQGLIAASNVSEGFVAFTNEEGSFRVSAKNQAFNCMPFSSVRFISNRDLVLRVAKEIKEAKSADGRGVHSDEQWIRERFAWISKQFGNFDMLPPSLWGTHASESFVGSWGRELGVSSYKAVRFEPEVVAIPGTEASKLRAAAKHVGCMN